MLLRNRLTAILTLLVGSTCVSLWIRHDMGLRDPRVAGSAILVLAFIKVRFVILDFMELRRAPRALRITAEIWVSSMTILLMTLTRLAAG